ncbi:MAG: hypothetical protein AB8F34_07070 [Akkermansiaceae bacterium]
MLTNKALISGCLCVTAVCLFSSPLLADEDVAESMLPVPLGGVEHEHTHGPRLSFQPRATLRAVYGDTDLEDSGLAHGGHDPIHDGFSIPDLSLGADILYGEHVSAFAESILTWNSYDGWDGEIEEAYVKFMNLPGGFELHAGVLLVAAGTQNNIHTHSWNFVDAHLGNVRFLGEDGLAIEGLELIWLPPSRWDDQLILSFGNALEHQHKEEEEHPADGIMHGHDEEAEEALWDHNVFVARYETTHWPRDTSQFVYGVSYIQGKNFMQKTARLYGLDFTYRYFEDENHSQQFIWRNEAMLRRVHTEEGKFEELALSSVAIYKLNPEWEFGLRYDYLEGVKDPKLSERHRISPSIARHFKLADQSHASLRLQYNYDHSDERGEDHSIWLQFSIEWGDADAHVH